jgi:hypothetical protein
VKHALACALALSLLAASTAGAQSPDPIEAIWEFNGGQIAVDRQGDGSFVGTIIRPTQLSECTHQNGEPVWAEIKAQPDGQYFGLHQYFHTADCSFSGRGMIALRVLQNEQGATFLRVCFDNPDSEPNEQPNIAPDGSNTTTQDGCRDSDLVSRQPTTPPKIDDIAVLPKSPARGCFSRRAFTIRLKEPIGDALAGAKVTFNNKNVPVKRGARLTARINLKGLPRGRYTVKIVAQTVRGKTIKGSRKYRTCGTKRRIGRVGPI